MKQKNPQKRELKLLVVALALMILGSFFAMLFNTSFFTVQVKEITFTTERGTLSALLYLPKGAGADDPRPVVVTTHGYLNTKEMQDAPSIEMSRRGYIVLDLDMYDHGDSRWDADIPVGSQFGTFWIYSVTDAANRAAQQINARVNAAALFSPSRNRSNKVTTITPSVTAAIRNGLYRTETLPLNKFPRTIPSPASSIMAMMALSPKPETLIINGLI